MRIAGLLIFGAALMGVPFVVAATDGRAEVFAVSSLATVRERGTPRGEARARLSAARGEWESFQVVVRAGASPLGAVEVTAGPLVGPGGARVGEVRVYRVGFVTLAKPSSVEGRAGAWPDPLIPSVDAYAGERRRAFPHAVPARGDLAAWIDVFVPRDAKPGRYTGAVRVRDGATTLGEIPVELEVHPFALPATSSLPVTYGFATRTALLGHLGRAATESSTERARLGAELARRYGVAALRHRISLHGMSFDPPELADKGGRVRLDTRAYDAEVGPFLDGRADPGGPADGARWSAVELRVPGRLVGAAREAYVRELVRHLDGRGWLSRTFDYTADEPPDPALPDVRRRAMALRKAASVPRLVTRPLTPALDGAVDLWCPTVNQLDDKPGGNPGPPRAAYDEHARHGDRLWWYQSCMSHGCDIVGGDYFTGWPSLVVDAPAVAHRVQQWLTFRYRVGGELYFNTVEAYAGPKGDGPGDPWRDLLRHGGNGDGTLFYPGRPDAIGGATHVPVESIRLKRIRDGLEDYEYLRLLAARAGFPAADALARPVAERTFRWDHDPEHLLAARREIAAKISGAATKAAVLTH